MSQGNIKRQPKFTKEVEKWKPFIADGITYDMSHLDAFSFTYTQEAKDDKAAQNYKFKVTFSCHCFTSGGDKLTEADKQQLAYDAPRETRYFHAERHELSHQLPEIIQNLHHVFHTKHETFFTTKLINQQTGEEETYEVFFTVYKEHKKLRIHVQSAYIPRDRKGAKGEKIRFSVIAYKTRMGKKIKSPPKKW